MIRPTTKHVLEICAGLAAALAVAVGFFAWSLARGPIALDRFAPMLEAAIGAELGMTAALRDPRAVWDSERKQLVLIADELRVLADSDLVARVENIGVEFRIRDLVAGRFVPERVNLESAAIAATRRMDGSVRFGLQPVPETVPESVLAEAAPGPGNTAALRFLADALRRARDPADRFAPLREISVTTADVSFYDARSRAFFRAPAAGLTLSRSERGIAFHLDGDVFLSGQPWPVVISADYDLETEIATAAFAISDLVPADAADAIPGLDAFDQVRVPLNGRALGRFSADGEVLDIAADLTAGAGTVGVPGVMDTPRAIEAAAIRARLIPGEARVELQELSARTPTSRMTLSGEVTATDRSPEDWRAWRYDVALDWGETDLFVPGLSDRRAAIDELKLSAKARLAPLAVDLSRFELKTGDGTVTAFGTYADGGTAPLITAEGTVDGFTIDQLLSIWPVDLAEGARTWISWNVSQGTIRNGAFEIDAANGEFGQSPLPDGAVTAQFEIVDATSTYTPGLPPLRGATGKANLRGNDFTLVASGGQVLNTVVDRLRFYVTSLNRKRPPAYIEVDLKGPLPTVLSVLDMGPFGYPSRFGVDPAQTAGDAEASLRVVLPMKKGLALDEIDFSAEGTVDRFSFDNLAKLFDLTEGRLAMSLDTEGLQAEGPLKINGLPVTARWSERFKGPRVTPTRVNVRGRIGEPELAEIGLDLSPAFSGALAFDLDLAGNGPDIASAGLDLDLEEAALSVLAGSWEKPAGSPAQASFGLERQDAGGYALNRVEVTGAGLSVAGDAVLGPDFRLQSATFPDIRAGELIDISLMAGRNETGTLEMAVQGKRISAGALLDQYTQPTAGGTRQGNQEPARPGAGVELELSLDELYLKDETPLRKVSGEVVSDGRRLESVTLSAEIGKGAPLSISLIRATPEEQHLRIASGDAGAMIRNLTGFTQVSGGEASVWAQLIEGPEASGGGTSLAISGMIESRDFRVSNVPVLARLLTVASFSGLTSLLQGEGIGFKQLQVPFLVEGGVLSIDDGRAFGSALGLTLEGQLDRQADITDFRGTIVPSYGVNSFLGNIPLLGNVLTNRPGEGVLGITYSIQGPADQPQIYVNPLSALAPGFLRRLFQLPDGDGGDRDAPLEALPEGAAVPESQAAGPETPAP